MMRFVLPPSPRNSPPSLTEASRAYKLRVVAMLFSLLLFLAVYFGMIGATIWLIHDSFVGHTSNWILGVAAVLFLVFLVKPLFKRQKVDRDELIEVSRAEEPGLFEFLDALIAEVGAPRPKKVYVTHAVNAAVFYDSSALSLFLPTKKNLLIGLGLVNGLNVSELKAVLAHEFGHFSQRSMKLGTYVYVANRIIADMVWGRDSWDEGLRKLGSWEIRIAIFVWTLLAFVWVVRQLLGLLFRVINLFEAAMSRQMEFNADRVAVSVTGSDAIINGLYRTGFSDACLDYTLGELSEAKDHQLYTDDVFFHQTEAADHLRRLAKKPEWGVPPVVPETNPGAARIFEEDDESRPSMWASHPPNTAREANAKEVYVSCEIDERPAWALFHDPDSLRRKVTKHLLSRALGEYEASPASEVQAFIEKERAETTYDDKYHGFYNSGSLVLDDLETTAASAKSDSVGSEELASSHLALFDEALKARLDQIRDKVKELREVHGFIESGERKTSFRGSPLSKKKAVVLLPEMADSVKLLGDALRPKHKQIQQTYLQMAHALGEEDYDSLLSRYRFQDALQRFAGFLDGEEGTFADVMEILRQEEIEKNEWAMAKIGLEKMLDTLKETRAQSLAWTIPIMASFEEERILADFVFEGCDEQVLTRLSQTLVSDDVDGEFLDGLIGHYQQASGRLSRIMAKSVGGVLASQEDIAGRWHQSIRS